MRVGKTAAIHFLSQILVSVAGFIATLYIARELGAAILGTYAVVVALLSWLNIPGATIGSAVNKRISEGRDQSSFVSAGIVMNFGVALTLATLALIFASCPLWLNSPVADT